MIRCENDTPNFIQCVLWEGGELTKAKNCAETPWFESVNLRIGHVTCSHSISKAFDNMEAYSAPKMFILKFLGLTAFLCVTSHGKKLWLGFAIFLSFLYLICCIISIQFELLAYVERASSFFYWLMMIFKQNWFIETVWFHPFLSSELLDFLSPFQSRNFDSLKAKYIKQRAQGFAFVSFLSTISTSKRANKIYQILAWSQFSFSSISAVIIHPVLIFFQTKSIHFSL